jgi:Glycosyl transferases group 1.
MVRQGFMPNLETLESFAEKILWLLSHREEAQNMGKRGQEVVKKRFSAETMAFVVLAIYQEVSGVDKGVWLRWQKC